MKFAMDMRSTGDFRDILHGVLQPEQATAAMERRIGQVIRQGLAVVLSALMIMVPMGQGTAVAQSAPPPAPPVADSGQPAPQEAPLTPDQLDQLVAPIALYPDALVAQVLAASTYPTQVVEANRWLKAQGNAPAAQIAAGANTQNWDASVKALTAFPAVLGADGPQPSMDNRPGQCLLQPAPGRDGFSAGDAPEGAGCRSTAQHAAADGGKQQRPDCDRAR